MGKKKWMAMLLAGTVTLSMLGGCGSWQEQTPKEAENTKEEHTQEGENTKDGGSGNISLRFCWWGSDTRHEKTLEALAKYEELTGVHIEGEYSTISSYYEKLVTQLAGGTAPDIIQLDYPWISLSISKPMTSLILVNLIWTIQRDGARKGTSWRHCRWHRTDLRCSIIGM